MAEVRLCFQRVTHTFGYYFCELSSAESHSRHCKCLMRCSNITAAFLWAGSCNGGLGGAAGSQSSYRSSPPLSGPDWELGRHPSKNSCNGGCAGKRPYTLTQHRIQVCRTLFSRSLCVQRLHWRPSAPSRAYSGNGSRTEPLYKTKSGYYEILEVSPTATKAQIKTAYYKQSFTYHPDRNAGSDGATVRFSEISEAYAVLGNKSLRKKYDLGLLSLSDLTATPPRSSSKDRPAGSAKQQRSQSVVGRDARGGVFDFDTFFKSHYGEQLQRQRDIRERQEEIQRMKEEALNEKWMGKMMHVGVGLLLVMAVGLVLSLKKH